MVVTRVIILMIFMLSAFATQRASAERSTGARWLQECQAGKVTCATYILAVDEFHSVTEPPRYCTPSGVTIGQMEKVVIKFLQDHPDQLHLPFIVLN
jgi:hypothetical protein